mgnify:CR=1 FL=1
MKKLLYVLFVFMIFSQSFSGEWSVKESGETSDIVFTGLITQDDIVKWQDYINKYDKINITIHSPGGVYYAGIKMGYISYTNKKKITTTVSMALSAAAYWALGVWIDNVKFVNDPMAAIGFHFPKMRNNEHAPANIENMAGMYHQHFILVIAFYPDLKPEETAIDFNKRVYDSQTKATELFNAMIYCYDPFEEEGVVLIKKDKKITPSSMAVYFPPDPPVNDKKTK